MFDTDLTFAGAADVLVRKRRAVWREGSFAANFQKLAGCRWQGAVYFAEKRIFCARRISLIRRIRLERRDSKSLPKHAARM